MRLKDKVAIITGGGRGIGKALAFGFANQGATIVAAARTESEVIEVAEKVKLFGKESLGIVCDVSNEEEVKNLVSTTMNKFGKIDV